MLRSKWLSKVGVALFALLLAATWIAHLDAIKHLGARYTYAELVIFAVSIIAGVSLVAGVSLAIRCWGLAAKTFIAGWTSAVVLAAILHVTFGWFLFSATSNAPWVAAPSSLVTANLLAELTVYAPAFLALFAVAAWVSHRLSIWHFAIFALVGSTAMIAPYVAWGIDFESVVVVCWPFRAADVAWGIGFDSVAWWPFRAADVAIGAMAGATFWYVARPAKSGPAVSV